MTLRHSSPAHLSFLFDSKKSLRRLLLIALLIGLVFAAQPIQEVQAADAAEITSLTDLYNDLGGPGWIDNTNWLTGDPCTNSWYGVTCNAAGNVTWVNLHSNDLSGDIDDVDLSGLAYLEDLNLNNNSTITGDIDGFDLSNNIALSGLYLNDNAIGGDIDGLNLINNINLEDIHLQNNAIGGDIDGFNLTFKLLLLDVYLNDNQIGGDIDGLDLSNNISLIELHLNDNQIGGDIDGLYLSNNGALRELYLNDNQIQGDIDGLNLTNNANLLDIFLYNNQITGDIDGFNLTNNTSLEYLYLYDNQIGGDIDGFNLTNNTALRYLYLNNNAIGGDIGGFNLTNNTALGYLYLNDNQIQGDPSGLTGLSSNLQFLYLNNNDMNGTVPDLTGTIVNNGTLALCSNPAINPSGTAAIDNFAETNDTTGWTAASGCGNIALMTNAACNGDDLDVTITAGDAPLNITGAGSGLPLNGVVTGTHTLTGPDTWTGVTVSETAGDTESDNLGDYVCEALVATAACNGNDLDITITGGSANFDLSADDPAAANQAQNNVAAGVYTLVSSGGDGLWTNITVNELGGDAETLNLADMTCPPPAAAARGSSGGSGSASGCNLVIDVEANREMVTPGAQVIWTVLVTNSGSGACQGVYTYGTMPGEFSISGITLSRGSLTWDGGQYYRVELGTLSVNETVTIILDSLLQGGAAITLPEGAAAQSAGQSICLTGHTTDLVNDTACVTLFPDMLPATGGEPVSQSQNWGWLAAAGLMIAGLGGYAVRRRRKV